MGKSQRDKGARRERELVNILRASGLSAKRVPLSGSCEGFKGDLRVERKTKDGTVNETWEVKSRSGGFKLIYDSLGLNAALAIKQDGKDWLVVMRLDDWIRQQHQNKEAE